MRPDASENSEEGTEVHRVLGSSSIAAPEARSLLAFVLDATRESLIAQPQRRVTARAVRRFRDLCARRRAGEPVAYLLRQREFFGRRFGVDRAVLIPRPETECVVEAALHQLKGRRRPSVLDLGTGSGCIAITLALERPDAQISAVDVSEPALELARANATALGARVTFMRGCWYAAAQGRYDLIVSNPPYVAADDPHLAALACEPREALAGGADGLECLRTVIGQASSHLTEVGTLIVEHGYDQGAAVRERMLGSGFRSVRTLTDLAGLERICLGQRC